MSGSTSTANGSIMNNRAPEMLFYPDTHAALTRLYPHLFPPIDALLIIYTTTFRDVLTLDNYQEDIVLGPNYMGGVARVPQGYQGVLTHAGTWTTDWGAGNTSIFSVLVNGTPVFQCATAYGSIDRPLRLPGPGLVLTQGDLVRIRLQNDGTLTRTMQIRLLGYLYPEVVSP